MTTSDYITLGSVVVGIILFLIANYKDQKKAQKQYNESLKERAPYFIASGHPINSENLCVINAGMPATEIMVDENNIGNAIINISTQKGVIGHNEELWFSFIFKSNANPDYDSVDFYIRFRNTNAEEEYVQRISRYNGRGPSVDPPQLID